MVLPPLFHRSSGGICQDLPEGLEHTAFPGLVICKSIHLESYTSRIYHSYIIYVTYIRARKCPSRTYTPIRSSDAFGSSPPSIQPSIQQEASCPPAQKNARPSAPTEPTSSPPPSQPQAGWGPPRPRGGGESRAAFSPCCLLLVQLPLHLLAEL